MNPETLLVVGKALSRYGFPEEFSMTQNTLESLYP